MNLLKDSWLPVVRRSGLTGCVRPHELVSHYTEDPVVALNFPRPDFNGAVIQWWIGLLQTAFAPRNQDHWLKLYMDPPGAEELLAALTPLAPYFELDGDGPRFMQDLDPLADAAQEPIAGLLIDAPGGNTQKLNKDLFVKRGGVESVCLACAAAALLTLQINAPSGGAGHNTSLRGGGPLTTLVVSTAHRGLEANLWRDVWLNVLTSERIFGNSKEPRDAPLDRIFPWARPTLTSEDANRQARKAARGAGGEAPDKARREITSADGHPLWAYWSTPRRIRLDFETTQPCTCDLCGAESATCIAHYRTRPYGANYTSGWRHPLSPYYKPKATDTELLPQHPHGAIGYRYWLALAGQHEDTTVSATVVSAFVERRKDLAEELDVRDKLPFRLRAFGFAMDNMKPLCWHEAVMPVPRINNEHADVEIRRYIQAAEIAASYLRGALRDAWFSKNATVKLDGFSAVVDEFWQSTEEAFYQRLENVSLGLGGTAADIDVVLPPERSHWHAELTRRALEIFERWAESGRVELGNPRRIVMARRQLERALHGTKLKNNILRIPMWKSAFAQA